MFLCRGDDSRLEGPGKQDHHESDRYTDTQERGPREIVMECVEVWHSKSAEWRLGRSEVLNRVAIDDAREEEGGRML